MVDVRKFEQVQVENLLALLDNLFTSGNDQESIKEVLNVVNLAMRRTNIIFGENSVPQVREREFSDLIGHMLHYDDKVNPGESNSIVTFLQEFVEVLETYYKYVDKDRKSIVDLCNVFRIVTEIYLHLDFEDEHRKAEVLNGIHELVDEWFLGNLTPPSSEEELPDDDLPAEEEDEFIEESLFETLLVSIEEGVAYVTLNRPEKRNAMNKKMLEELEQIFNDYGAQAHIRVIVITGSGSAFCSGADLDDMEKTYYSADEAQLLVMRLSRMLRAAHLCSKPIITLVNGAVYGGGIGLVCTADLVLAEKGVNFCFSEVRLGLAPATVAPFVVERIGVSNARRYFLTGERFSATDAQKMGMVTEVGELEELEGMCQHFISDLKAGGPQAIAECKELIRHLTHNSGDQHSQYTSELFIRLVSSDETHEGIQAFHNKTIPGWRISN